MGTLHRPHSVRPWGRRCALWGWRKGVSGGGTFLRCEGCLRSGTPPPPVARPLGWLLGSASHVLWAQVCGSGGPALSLWLARPVGAACRGGGGGPSPGGLACHRCEGRLVPGAVPPPAARPRRRAAGVPRPVCPGCGWCRRGDPAPAPQLAPLRACVARCGAGGRAPPGGFAFCRCEGRLSSGAPPPPTARPLGGLSGAATHVVWARMCGCGGPALSSWLAYPVGAACNAAGWGPSPGGMARHRCEGRLVSGAVPPPTARPLGRAAGVPRPVYPGCGWYGGGDPAAAPQRAPLRAGIARCGGGGRAFRGGAFQRCEGRLRSGAPPPSSARPPGGLSGSTTHMLWARMCGVGGPALSPWLACPVGAACRGDGGEPSPGGLACHRCEGLLVSGAVPPLAARPLGRAAGVPRPVCPGCGCCRRGDPAPAPQRAPLRAGIARCGGGGRASPGGVPFAVVRGVSGQALPLPRLPAIRACCRGPLHTCCGRRCAVVGAKHCPLGLHALRGLRAAGVVGGRPRGGWPATFVRCIWCQALFLPRSPILWDGQPGFRDLCVPGAVVAGLGTQQRPHSVRPCRPALRAVGVAEGRPRGGCLSPL